MPSPADALATTANMTLESLLIVPLLKKVAPILVLAHKGNASKLPHLERAGYFLPGT
jgi:hypothetical protein